MSSCLNANDDVTRKRMKSVIKANVDRILAFTEFVPYLMLTGSWPSQSLFRI